MEIRQVNDPAAWDTQVLALGGHPLQSAAWGDLKVHFGWQCVRLATRDGAAAAQMLVRPLAGLAVAYVPRGPMSSGTSEVDEALIAAIQRHARRRRAAFVRLEPEVRDGSQEAERLDALLRSKKFRPSMRTVQPRASLVLDLSPTEDQLLAAFSKGHRADIRRAERDGVTVRVGGVDDAELLYSLLQATQQRKSFAIHSAAYFRVLLETFGKAARLLIAEHAGAAVGAAIAIAWGGHGIYLVAGSNAQGLKQRAGHLLQWHAIRWARDQGAHTYDLWGIPDARARLEIDSAATDDERARYEEEAGADPLDGVYRFKKGWASSAVRTVPAYDRVYFAPAYWLWQRRRATSG